MITQDTDRCPCKNHKHCYTNRQPTATCDLIAANKARAARPRPQRSETVRGLNGPRFSTAKTMARGFHV